METLENQLKQDENIQLGTDSLNIVSTQGEASSDIPTHAHPHSHSVQSHTHNGQDSPKLTSIKLTNVVIDESSIISGSFGNIQKVITTKENIQEAIDNVASTGGTVFLTAGLYLIDYDIEIPSNVTLQGQGIETTVIFFGGAASSITVAGSEQYSVGTVSVNDESAAVTGAGTAWLTNLTTDHKIKLGDYWYEVAAVTGDGALTLLTNYTGANLAGATYDAAILTENVWIKDLMVMGSGTHGITENYTYNCNVYSVVSYLNTGDGIHIQNSSYPGLDIFLAQSNGGNGIYLQNVDHAVFKEMGAFECTGDGFNCDNMSRSIFVGCEAKGNGDDGIYITGSRNCVMTMLSSYNGGQGLELNASNYMLFMGSYEGNTSDGIKLTATDDYNSFSSCVCTNNGGYGINIAAATCDYNTVIGNVLTGNVSGTLQDLGTNTQKIEASGQVLLQSGTWTNTFTISGLTGDTDELYLLKVKARDTTAYSLRITFNGDNGANYSHSVHWNGRQAAAGIHSYNQSTGNNYINTNGAGDSKVNQYEFKIAAKSGGVRVVDFTVDAYTDTDNFWRNSGVGIWGNTADQITSITVTRSAGDTTSDGKWYLYKVKA